MYGAAMRSAAIAPAARARQSLRSGLAVFQTAQTIPGRSDIANTRLSAANPNAQPVRIHQRVFFCCVARNAHASVTIHIARNGPSGEARLNAKRPSGVIVTASAANIARVADPVAVRTKSHAASAVTRPQTKNPARS